MTRFLLLLAFLGVAIGAGPAAAQYRGPRSADHLFAASLWGARALWQNPAALGAVDEASIMLEGLVERDTVGDYPLSQYTIGFNSRGFSLGFRRDFFRVLVGPADSLISYGGNTWRVGFGRGLGTLGIGAAVSIYSGPKTTQDVDLGLRYQIGPGLALSVGVEHIGQPTVRDSSLRFGSGVGVSWTTLNGILGLDAEVQGHDKEADGGILMGYRGGLRLRTPGTIPLALTGVLELNSSFDIRRLLIGFAVGGEYLASLVGGGQVNGTNRLETISLLGQASRRFR
ncbi:MAG: hypothetical protein OEW06_01960 [Gemmatimonadota bacterium]|nr:hypothetical protein [Gemmatimonadota bacterium]